LPASTGNRIDVVKALRIGTSDVRVERIALGSFQYVRLLQHAQGGAERASAWVAVKAAAQLAISSVAGAGDQRIVLLEGAEQSLALPLTR
jgi:hypothetical protein